MLSAIFPIDCPPTAVNATKYPPFSSRKNAASGTSGSSRIAAKVRPNRRSVKYSTAASRADISEKSSSAAMMRVNAVAGISPSVDVSPRAADVFRTGAYW